MDEDIQRILANHRLRISLIRTLVRPPSPIWTRDDIEHEVERLEAEMHWGDGDAEFD